ncbi:hypothetical protein [Streptomyces sp. NPDC048637]|uniref:acyltransferase family protein n=1 Tax=Streptomyces sp. NPDC048637 TaxID=3155636 RepID=UPI00344364F3
MASLEGHCVTERQLAPGPATNCSLRRSGRRAGSAVPRRLGDASYSIYLWHWPLYVLLPQEVLGFGGWARTAVLMALSLAAAVLSKAVVEDPIRFRARWATGRTGLAVLAASALAAASLWLLIPRPQLGAHSVDVTHSARRRPRRGPTALAAGRR